MAYEPKLVYRHILLSVNIFKENMKLFLFKNQEDFTPKSGLMLSLEQWAGAMPVFPCDNKLPRGFQIVYPGSPRILYCLRDTEAGFKVLYFARVIRFLLPAWL